MEPQLFHGFAGRKVVTRPIIRRTRSWRGNMRACKDNSNTFSRQNIISFFVISPIALVVSGALGLAVVYWLFGHDKFFQELMGYESESMYESRVNPNYSIKPETSLVTVQHSAKFYNKLEKPRFERLHFDVFRKEVAEQENTNEEEPIKEDEEENYR